MAIIVSKETGRRNNFSIEFKASLAARACEPGVSVARLARDNDLNANMLFRWRREYRAGTLCMPVEAGPVLMPVNLTAQAETSIIELPNPSTRFGNAPANKPIESVIEIRIAGAAVRVEGEVDVVRLRAVLAALRG